MISMISPLPAPNPMLAFAVALAVGAAVTLEPAPELELAPAPAPLAEFALAPAPAPAPPFGPVLGLTRVMLALAAAALAPELVISTAGVTEEEECGSGATGADVANADAKDDAPPRRPSPWLARMDFGRECLCCKMLLSQVHVPYVDTHQFTIKPTGITIQLVVQASSP